MIHQLQADLNPLSFMTSLHNIVLLLQLKKNLPQRSLQDRLKQLCVGIICLNRRLDPTSESIYGCWHLPLNTCLYNLISRTFWHHSYITGGVTLRLEWWVYQNKESVEPSFLYYQHLRFPRGMEGREEANGKYFQKDERQMVGLLEGKDFETDILTHKKLQMRHFFTFVFSVQQYCYILVG